MSNDHGIDKRALKLLSKYNLLAEYYKRKPTQLSQWEREYMEKHGTSAENLQYMKDKGLAFDGVDMGHDEALEQCFAFRNMLAKRTVTDAFLASLTSASLAHRAGLAAYAIMQRMPDHRYEETPAGFCRICSAKEARSRIDLTALNHERYAIGSMLGHRTPYELQFFLSQHIALERVAPTQKDVDVFNAILARLDGAANDCKPVEMEKILRRTTGLSATVDQSRALLEILGFCSILESKKHRGYLTTYTNTGLAPAKSHSSDWAYPVDFWTGADGVNREALQFWFGDYEGIELGPRA